jgi:hypothetical protein
MPRRLAVAVLTAALLAAAASALLVASAAERPSGKRASHAPGHQFVGYWAGIDPLDGGDSRRAITRNADGTFALIGRDTVFTLCDGTDRAIVTAGALTVAGPALVSDDFIIACTGNGSTVHLKVRYDVVDRHVVRETLTAQDGAPVDVILFHLLSER